MRSMRERLLDELQIRDRLFVEHVERMKEHHDHVLKDSDKLEEDDANATDPYIAREYTPLHEDELVKVWHEHYPIKVAHQSQPAQSIRWQPSLTAVRIFDPPIYTFCSEDGCPKRPVNESLCLLHQDRLAYVRKKRYERKLKLNRPADYFKRHPKDEYIGLPYLLLLHPKTMIVDGSHEGLHSQHEAKKRKVAASAETTLTDANDVRNSPTLSRHGSPKHDRGESISIRPAHTHVTALLQEKLEAEVKKQSPLPSPPSQNTRKIEIDSLPEVPILKQKKRSEKKPKTPPLPSLPVSYNLPPSHNRRRSTIQFASESVVPTMLRTASVDSMHSNHHEEKDDEEVVTSGKDKMIKGQHAWNEKQSAEVGEEEEEITPARGPPILTRMESLPGYSSKPTSPTLTIPSGFSFKDANKSKVQFKSKNSPKASKKRSSERLELPSVEDSEDSDESKETPSSSWQRSSGTVLEWSTLNKSVFDDNIQSRQRGRSRSIINVARDKAKDSDHTRQSLALPPPTHSPSHADMRMHKEKLTQITQIHIGLGRKNFFTHAKKSEVHPNKRKSIMLHQDQLINMILDDAVRVPNSVVSSSQSSPHESKNQSPRSREKVADDTKPSLGVHHRGRRGSVTIASVDTGTASGRRGSITTLQIPKDDKSTIQVVRRLSKVLHASMLPAFDASIDNQSSGDRSDKRMGGGTTVNTLSALDEDAVLDSDEEDEEHDTSMDTMSPSSSSLHTLSIQRDRKSSDDLDDANANRSRKSVQKLILNRKSLLAQVMHRTAMKKVASSEELTNLNMTASSSSTPVEHRHHHHHIHLKIDDEKSRSHHHRHHHHHFEEDHSPTSEVLTEDLNTSAIAEQVLDEKVSIKSASSDEENEDEDDDKIMPIPVIATVLSPAEEREKEKAKRMSTLIQALAIDSSSEESGSSSDSDSDSDDAVSKSSSDISDDETNSPRAIHKMKTQVLHHMHLSTNTTDSQSVDPTPTPDVTASQGVQNRGRRASLIPTIAKK